MRALVAVGLSALLVLAAPATASADVIFDPADADDLAATLAEATRAQGVCYGWDVQVNDQVSGDSESVGSDRGAGIAVDESSCSEYVVLNVYITWTSESSESEDSASYDVVSSPGGPSRSDLEELGLNMDGLTGDDVDVAIGLAVAALPLLAADTGMADGIEAAPQSGDAPADASLTDDPSSDWWRNNGGTLLWGLGLLLAGGLFAWWVFRSRPRRAKSYRVPDTVPDDLVVPATYEPPTGPIAVRPEPPTEPVPVQEPEAAPAKEKDPETAEKLDEPPELDPPVEPEAPEPPAAPKPSADVASPDQKDKE
ncbi:hypothetical protein [Actinophytocola sp. NPDC049390]|uniref:hypothetical protein n=1 Tax=Actinophytocola sp. NPDC049390 TaxID=3363894 RepID=UPI0037A905D2